MSDVEILLVSASCESEIGDATEVPEMLRRVFVVAKDHYMVRDPDVQIKGALNAVLKRIGADSPDGQKLTTEIQLLGKMNAWLRAAQAGLSVDPPEVPEGYEPFGIMKLWHETRL